MREARIVGIIPARWNSSRFPGKPLAQLLGKSLIQTTYENALRSTRLDRLVVATDDQRIYDHVAGFRGEVYLTSSSCRTGTERVYETTERFFPNAEIVVNIQGDEPCLAPSVIDALITKLQEEESCCMTTPLSPLSSFEEACNPHIVKCIFDQKGRALYFSRSPIPFAQKTRPSYYRHLGVYGFRRPFLTQYMHLPPSLLQDAEDLEQLKVLEAGYPIHVVVVEEQGIGVDRPEDLQKVEAILCANTSS